MTARTTRRKGAMKETTKAKRREEVRRRARALAGQPSDAARARLAKVGEVVGSTHPVRIDGDVSAILSLGWLGRTPVVVVGEVRAPGAGPVARVHLPFAALFDVVSYLTDVNVVAAQASFATGLPSGRLRLLTGPAT